MVAALRRKLTAELDDLVEELTVNIPDRLGREATAREMEDVRAAQHRAQARVRSLKALLAGLDQAHPDTIFTDRAGFGSVVRVRDVRTREESTYTLLAGPDLDLDSGQISLGSPVGQALLGCVAGEEVDVSAPQRKVRLRVLSVTTLFDGHELEVAPVTGRA